MITSREALRQSKSAKFYQEERNDLVRISSHDACDSGLCWHRISAYSRDWFISFAFNGKEMSEKDLEKPTDPKPETDEKQRNKADNDWADRCAKDHSVTKQEETFYACLLRAALAEGRRRNAAETAQREEVAAREAWEASKDAWDEADDGDGRIDRWQGESFEDAWKKRRREREKFNRISDPHALIYLEDDEPLVLSELVEYWKGLSKREETAARDALTLLCETYTDIADRFNPNAVEDFVAKWKQRRFNK